MGALKPWLYALWLPLAGHGAWAVRLPMILLSAVTLGLIYRVLRRVVEPGLALALLALAAGDALYLFTSRYDWGPVVLQRLCFWGALAILTGGASARRAFFAGLLCGLGLFDKLSFHWLLVAGAATALIFYPRQLRERLHDLEIIVNGEVAARSPLGEPLDFSIEINASSWVAARVRSDSLQGEPEIQAHSNPVYFLQGGKPVHLAPARKSLAERWADEAQYYRNAPLQFADPAQRKRLLERVAATERILASDPQ